MSAPFQDSLYLLLLGGTPLAAPSVIFCGMMSVPAMLLYASNTALLNKFGPLISLHRDKVFERKSNY